MEQISKIADKYDLCWEWKESLGIPCIAYKQKASDNETVISYNFIMKYCYLAESKLLDADDLEKSFVEFERKYFSRYFFREDTDLKWNYYLLLIVSEEESRDFNICQLEQDDKYLRKLVMTEEEFAVYISHGRNMKNNHGQVISGLDIYAEWQRELSQVGVEGILTYSFENARVQNYIEVGTPIRFQGSPVENWENDSQGSPRFLVEGVQTLHLDGFRVHCLSRKLEIPLTKVNLISGCNGTGKSSICSALEYAFTGEISEAGHEEGEAKVTFQNREDASVSLNSKMLTKQKKELDRLWYGTVTAAGKSSLNRNFHTFNYLGLEASGKYMQELDINKLVKNVLFGTEVTEAEQKMYRYGRAFADKEKDYRKQQNKLSLDIEELQVDYTVKEISVEELADKFQSLGYKGEVPLITTEMSVFLKNCQRIFFENNQYVEILSLKCDKDETGNIIMERMRLLDEKHEVYRALRNNREQARRDLQEAHQKCEDSSFSIRKLYEKINQIQILIEQGEGVEYRFSCRQDFLAFKNKYEKSKRTKDELSKWLDDYLECIYIEADKASLDEQIQIKGAEIRELRDKIDEIRWQVEQHKKQNDNLQTIVQEIIALAEQYGSLNEHAKNCPACGRKFASRDKLLEAISHQKQIKIHDDTSLMSLFAQEAIMEMELRKERDSLYLLRSDQQKVLQKGSAIWKLKSLMVIDGVKSGEDIKREVVSYINQLQGYLESNLNIYIYVKKVLNVNEFVDFPEEEEWFIYLEKLLQNLKERKAALEALLKEQNEKEQELNKKYQKLMETNIELSEQEWEECRQKANGIQTLKRVWEIDGDIPVLRWVENYNTLKQEAQYAEEAYRKKQDMDFRKAQIAKLEEEKKTIEERMKKCQAVCKIIEKQRKLEDVMEGFLGENAKQIELFFKLLHRPKEFGALKIEDGKISFIRRSNGQLAESQQMSTGQRMALAFSVMITLHIGASNAPNFLMLDEPVANLDDMHVLNLIDLLRELAIGGTQIIITTADSQMAKFLRRKFSFLKDEYSHFALIRKGDAQTAIDVIHYRPDKKAAENIRHLN